MTGEFTALNILLDQHDGGVRSNSTEDIVEKTLDSLVGSLRALMGLQDFVLDSLKLVIVQVLQVLADCNQMTSNISS